MSPAQPAGRKAVYAAFGCALFVAALGGLATDLSPWYYALIKPAWQPPDWLFGPVWTTIFALCALAGLQAWRQAPGAAQRRRLLQVFAVNLALNTLWSLLFFRLRRPDFALVEVAALWLSIVALMWTVWPYARNAALLLAPYLAWVSFASVLNLSIVRLNAPFTSS